MSELVNHGIRAIIHFQDVHSFYIKLLLWWKDLCRLILWGSGERALRKIAHVAGSQKLAWYGSIWHYHHRQNKANVTKRISQAIILVNKSPELSRKKGSVFKTIQVLKIIEHSHVCSRPYSCSNGCKLKLVQFISAISDTIQVSQSDTQAFQIYEKDIITDQTLCSSTGGRLR